MVEIQQALKITRETSRGGIEVYRFRNSDMDEIMSIAIDINAMTSRLCIDDRHITAFDAKETRELMALLAKAMKGSREKLIDKFLGK